MIIYFSILKKINPINTESIGQWVGKFDDFDLNEIKFIEPLLKKFNYSLN